MMLTCRTNSRNQLKIGVRNDDVRLSPAMRLVLCAGSILAGWYALHYLGRRLTVCVCPIDEQLTLRDSTSDRRSAARWENEGGAMLMGHHDNPVYRE